MNPTKITDYRLQSGGHAVLEALKDVNMDKLIFTLYLPIKNEETKRLVYFFEQQLITAKLDGAKFLKTRPKKIKEVCRWIKENNKYQLFADFSMYVYRNSETNNNARHKVMIAYISTLMDVWTNLAPYGKVWYGLDKNGKPLLVNEPYGAYDVIGYEVLEKLKGMRRDSAQAIKLLKDTIEYEETLKFIRSDERNITNTIYTMLGLINTNNKDFIYPSNGWLDHCTFVRDFPRKYKTSEYWLDMLDKRSFLLDSEGVEVKCVNCGGFFNTIRFKEEFMEDGLIVLFKITDIRDNRSTMGYIDLRKKFTYSIMKNATDKLTGKCIHDDIINFVIEVYCELTCLFEKDESTLATKKLKSLKEAENLSCGQPGIYCHVKPKSESAGGTKQGTKKEFHTVDAFIRKANSSEEAKANARNYGLILPQGYTFVRTHTRGKHKD